MSVTEQQSRQFVEAAEQRDLETLSTMLVPDATLVQPFSFSGAQEPGAVFEGRDEVLGYLRQAFALMGRIHFVDERITVAADGETSFVQANGDFTTADGRPYRNVYVFRIDWRGDRIAHVEEYGTAQARELPPMSPPDLEKLATEARAHRWRGRTHRSRQARSPHRRAGTTPRPRGRACAAERPCPPAPGAPSASARRR